MSNETFSLSECFKLELEKSVELNASTLSFQHAIKIYMNKPQVINKWVAGNMTLSIDSNDLLKLDKNISKCINDGSMLIEKREFLSKNNKIFKSVKYLIISDMSCTNILFYPLLEASDDIYEKYASINLCHLFQFDASEFKLRLFVDRDKVTSATNQEIKDRYQLQINWLSANLLPKLLSWSLNVKTDENFTCANLNTLTLYENMVNDYNSLYQHLKEIYWHRFSSIWFEMTNTNPEKFIHEDISIAAYLILTWRHFLDSKVKCFVDLGCGNGLLVYILNEQGYNGYGVDMRKRKIWANDFYSTANTRLIEKTIDPRLDVYPDCDYLIANHSDELTPWLPIIALKSSKLSNSPCNFSLIPCCLWNFDSKFELKKNKESRYDTYLSYLHQICQSCNFRVYKDKLRIPSTKNVCFTCFKLAYTMNDLDLNEMEISNNSEKVNAKIIDICKSNLNNLDEKVSFKARDLVLENAKSSRNCTKNVEYELRIFIVRRVLEYLLSAENSQDELIYIHKHDGTKWNSGRLVSLNQIAGLFDKEVLNKLKLECGGIKTLLKNHYQMFQVVNKDKVKLKVWQETNDNKVKQSTSKTKTSECVKTKNCLFDMYHPDGCLLKESECQYIHS